MTFSVLNRVLDTMKNLSAFKYLPTKARINDVYFASGPFVHIIVNGCDQATRNMTQENYE